MFDNIRPGFKLHNSS